MRKLLATAAAAVLFLAMAVPVSAAPPERSEDLIWTIFPDEEHGVVAFWNITRDDYCAWEASDFDGDPPVAGPVAVKFVSTPTGPIVASYWGSGPLELWTLDENAELTGPCEDTDDSSGPWAIGTAQSRYNDNDLDHGASLDAGLHRTNAFGDRGQGTVWDADGHAWSFSWLTRVLFDANGEVREVVPYTTQLHRRG
jgi:hypothetical protein